MAEDDDWLHNEPRELPVQESLGLRASVDFCLTTLTVALAALAIHRLAARGAAVSPATPKASARKAYNSTSVARLKTMRCC